MPQPVATAVTSAIPPTNRNLGMLETLNVKSAYLPVFGANREEVLAVVVQPLHRVT
ncbi:hypothetical protein FHR32_003392 [Streptosporangium album]|uniref:Uncharacterized protein n=1 Tax=Streptosporangium album TaxID=47479 RepID=A0A7W7W971_9ACTN|nr:hypothetical protein [Streptosporangium album]MBB4939087.1 hypothetical protein [Streptosporangium album]